MLAYFIKNLLPIYIERLGNKLKGKPLF